VKRSSILAVAGVISVALSGCSYPLYDRLPRGQAAYSVIPPESTAADRKAFLIAPGDELSLAVVGESDLSVEKLVVDDSGTIQVPLAGEVAVAGHTPGEATRMIQQVLGTKGLRNPQVALNIGAPVLRTVAVEGQVTKPGVYPVSPATTLLSAVSMAESTTKIARLNAIVIFRIKDGQRLVARFNLERIRGGADPDPQILPGDTVVVGFSQAKSFYRDLLTAAPLLNVFAHY